jgi:hypothetical protein
VRADASVLRQGDEGRKYVRERDHGSREAKGRDSQCEVAHGGLLVVEMT